MIINKLDIENQILNVTFNYNEIKDISNGLYYIQKEKPEYLKAYTQSKFLFDMIKHGNIQPETIVALNNERLLKKL